jgi:hypothetical protein
MPEINQKNCGTIYELEVDFAVLSFANMRIAALGLVRMHSMDSAAFCAVSRLSRLESRNCGSFDRKETDCFVQKKLRLRLSPILSNYPRAMTFTVAMVKKCQTGKTRLSAGGQAKYIYIIYKYKRNLQDKCTNELMSNKLCRINLGIVRRRESSESINIL